MIEPVRIESLPAMLCVGIRRRHSYVDPSATITRQWQDFRELGPVQGARGDTTYGIMCGADAESFEYMTGVEVSDFAEAPADLGRIRIPAQTYAVFVAPDAASIGATWMAVWQEWLPRSAYEMANTPEFERYPAAFATRADEPREIWASVRPRT